MTVGKTVTGGAARTTLSAPITSTVPAAGATFTIADATGYPTANFVIDVFIANSDGTRSNEEKIFCSSRLGTTLTVGTAGRGYDGSTAASHAAGETVIHNLDALTVQALINHVDVPATAEADHSTLLNAARHDVTARHAFGAALGTPAAAADVGTAGAAGSGTVASRSDHVHKIGTGAINAAGMFAAGVVDAAAIATDAVGSAEIVAGAVGTAELADDSVTAAKIAANAVGSSEIAANAVDTSEINDAAVTLAKHASGLRPVQVVTSSTRPGSPTLGDPIFETDTLRRAVWDGSAWRHQSTAYIASGSLATPFAATDAVGPSAISFGVTFAAAPIVVVTAQCGSNNDVVADLAGAPTTTGCSVRVFQNDRTSITDAGVKVHWIAIGTLN